MSTPDGDKDDIATVRRLNLNLLYSLDAILNARSLADAGRAVSLSQPAMSGALRRLRDQFGDDLIFFIAGERMLTPLAEALRPRVRELLREIEHMFDLRVNFDPRTARAKIVVATSEEFEILLLGRVFPALLREAPNVQLSAVPIEAGSAERSLRNGADIVLLPERLSDPALAKSRLVLHALSCIVWEEHPTVGLTITAEQYLESRHVVVEDAIAPKSNLPEVTRRFLERRRVAVSTSHYSALPRSIIGTDLVATASSWLLQFFASMMPLRVIPLPFENAPDAVVAQWSHQRDGDAVLGWFLEALRASLSSMPTA